MNHNVLGPRVREVFDATESWEMERQGKVEGEARKLLAAGKNAEAVEALQRFTDANCARVESEYRRFGETLPATLKAAGIQYLFMDYMKEWTSRSRVPLE